jgi:hypothetical protein
MREAWTSFWDLAPPEEAAALVTEMYGVLAAREAARCAVAAKADGRQEDRRYWMAVLAVVLEAEHSNGQ